MEVILAMGGRVYVWRVVEFVAGGQVDGGWSSLWRVVELMARRRVDGGVVELIADGRVRGS
jgi:hypothetical protein